MRCSTSGRLTPAAATLMRTSPGLGAGSGRSTGFSTSGPPGWLISKARIFEGRAMRSISLRGRFNCGSGGYYAGEENPMAQFRVEFVLDPASGKYLAELYNPENADELIVRTEALYPTQAAAVLGLVSLFKNAILKFPPPSESPRSRPKGSRRRAAPKKKSSAAKGRKRPARRSAPRRSSSAP